MAVVALRSPKHSPEKPTDTKDRVRGQRCPWRLLQALPLLITSDHAGTASCPDPFQARPKSDTPRVAGGLVSGAASKAVVPFGLARRAKSAPWWTRLEASAVT